MLSIAPSRPFTINVVPGGTVPSDRASVLGYWRNCRFASGSRLNTVPVGPATTGAAVVGAGASVGAIVGGGAATVWATVGTAADSVCAGEATVVLTSGGTGLVRVIASGVSFVP